jgi:GNAT superfamily N-acetyltransferase
MLSHRLARRDDAQALSALIEAAISELQKPFLDERQIAASHAFMGLDTQLIDDGTYFIVEDAGQIVGCGGWSRRATLYGNDNSSGRDAKLLMPEKDPARIRAMYTHPSHVRKGIGRLIIRLCENAARNAGFHRVELMSTMSGVPLYLACGYQEEAHITSIDGGAAVPLTRMTKKL